MKPNPVIVVGAGASHNYSRYSTPPPLTNHLVNPEFLDLNIVQKYTEASGLFSEIAPQIIDQKKSFEEVLTVIKKDLGHHSHRKNQLTALQFYLKDYFEKVSNNFQSINNYHTLMSKIKDYSEGKACLVTFNYDTLIEQTLGYNRFGNLSSYINTHPYIIKLHGSHDWAYIGQKSAMIDLEFSNIKNSFDYLKNDPDYVNRIRNKGGRPFHINEIAGSGQSSGLFQFPAIAVPIIDKQDFLCPDNHIDTLRRNLEQTDRLLIIGWKAGDSNFLDFMRDYLGEKVSLTVVSSKIESAKEIAERLNGIKSFSSTKFYGGGFSNFVASDKCTEFFTHSV